jgi:IS30 family transposase
MVHIDVHSLRNIRGEDPKKKKYLAGIIDDATRIVYAEVIHNKKASTLASFMRRAYIWFKKNHNIVIHQILSDNGLEFTTHHADSRYKHVFEIELSYL